MYEVYARKGNKLSDLYSSTPSIPCNVVTGWVNEDNEFIINRLPILYILHDEELDQVKYACIFDNCLELVDKYNSEPYEYVFLGVEYLGEKMSNESLKEMYSKLYDTMVKTQEKSRLYNLLNQTVTIRQVKEYTIDKQFSIETLRKLK